MQGKPNQLQLNLQKFQEDKAQRIQQYPHVYERNANSKFDQKDLGSNWKRKKRGRRRRRRRREKA